MQIRADQAFGFQAPQCLADGPPPNAKFARQIAFDQLLPRNKPPFVNTPDDSRHNLVDRSRPGFGARDLRHVCS